MSALPSLTARHALFLDFDGTLTDIAAQPHAVQVPAGLTATLAALERLLGGALAIVTGRLQSDIDGFLALPGLPLASEHGAEFRLGGAHFPAAELPALAPVRQAAEQLAARCPGLLVEAKRAGVALHFRQAPHLEPLCRETLERAMQGFTGLELLSGKCVYEVKPAGVHKGRAIAEFMRQPPFAGRIPLFAGDDVTDEAGFATALELGGTAIKVGDGITQAPFRCPTPTALRAWLTASRSALESAP
ncbi:MAG: trehalose-phosphatase [Acidovorax sp. SCN 68-22]|nr:MAG: trehalose-phosphatase [Acidovorax sp. SCN 68-22]